MVTASSLGLGSTTVYGVLVIMISSEILLVIVPESDTVATV